MVAMPLDLTIRWPESEPRPEELFRQAGIAKVIAGPPPGAVTEGLWPGVTREPTAAGRGDESASASREPWVDANGYLVQHHRATGSGPVVLAYDPPKSGERVLPFGSVELGLVEARVNGGDFALTLDARYREALQKGDPKALAAWKSLGETARWLRQHESLFGLPALPAITMLAANDETKELANLMFRRGGSPALVARPPAQPGGILALVAAGVESVPEAAWEHARAGGTVVIDSKPDPSWAVLRKDEDRTLYRLGRGQVMAYHERVQDSSEFALDVIDIVTHKRRAARLWNALATIPLATTAPGGALLHAINYGAPVESEVQARVQGHFSRAALLRPGHAAQELKIARRGSTSEVFLPRLDVVATVRFWS